MEVKEGEEEREESERGFEKSRLTGIQQPRTVFMFILMELML